MKTFKLKHLEVMANDDEGIARRKVELYDGLVINREEELGWLIEAFIPHENLTYFKEIEETDELMIKVKITRPDNDPAFFITKIVSVNEISDEKINILFSGKVVDHRKSKIEDMLKMIIEEGYQGESLLAKFKELI